MRTSASACHAGFASANLSVKLYATEGEAGKEE